jgi:hypothetical protein
VYSQELNCQVTINGQQVDAPDPQIFRDMEKAIQSFMNDQKWTSQRFEDAERIQCRFNMILMKESEVGEGRYIATAAVSSSRPAYGTNYQSPVLKFLDDNWNFTFLLNDPLIFNTNNFSSNLTSILGFYAYLILGMDYDTFGDQSGTNLYTTAFQISNLASTNTGAGNGWNLNNSNDRVTLIDKLNNPTFAQFRTALYQYHRLGIDLLESEPEEARKNILEALIKVKDTQEANPLTTLITTFMDTKREELLQIFSRADEETKINAEAVLSVLDPANAGRYKKAFKTS